VDIISDSGLINRFTNHFIVICNVTKWLYYSQEEDDDEEKRDDENDERTMPRTSK
jgi:hypothetical protein